MLLLSRLNGIVALSAGVLLATALVVGCGGGRHDADSAATAEPVEVDTRVAALEEVPVTVEATGSIEPRVRVSPGTKVLGRIAEVACEEGQHVRAGDVLVRLEKRDLEAAVNQARAAVTMAEAQLENARAQHDRIVALHAKGSVTDKNLEDASAAYRVAEAAVEQATANLAAAQVMLGYAEIRSPVSGWVVAKMAEAGDMASPGAPLVTVEDLSRVKVVVEVPESDVVGLAPGDPATVTIDVAGRSQDAEVARVVPAGDPRSRTYRVELLLDNPEGRLKSGMFARAGFRRGSREAVVVPGTAVLERGQLRGLFVVDSDGRARLRWIRLRGAPADRFEVLSGLEPGERYLVAPPSSFADGTPVVTR
jgi:RND family efflux transporter MFP subunit